MGLQKDTTYAEKIALQGDGIGKFHVETKCFPKRQALKRVGWDGQILTPKCPYFWRDILGSLK